MRAGEYKGWLPTLFVGQLLQGATVGIVGAGRIGAAYARMARAPPPLPPAPHARTYAAHARACTQPRARRCPPSAVHTEATLHALTRLTRARSTPLPAPADG
jgi:hypothetical protein